VGFGYALELARDNKRAVWSNMGTDVYYQLTPLGGYKKMEKIVANS